MGKTKQKRRPSSEQKQTKEQLPQCRFKEAHILAKVNEGQNERKKKRTSTKQKQTEEKVQQCTVHVVSKMQGGICFVQLKIRQQRIIRTHIFWSRSLVTLLSSASHYLFLTDC